MWDPKKEINAFHDPYEVSTSIFLPFPALYLLTITWSPLSASFPSTFREEPTSFPYLYLSHLKLNSFSCFYVHLLKFIQLPPSPLPPSPAYLVFLLVSNPKEKCGFAKIKGKCSIRPRFHSSSITMNYVTSPKPPVPKYYMDKHWIRAGKPLAWLSSLPVWTQFVQLLEVLHTTNVGHQWV